MASTAPEVGTRQGRRGEGKGAPHDFPVSMVSAGTQAWHKAPTKPGTTRRAGPASTPGLCGRAGRQRSFSKDELELRQGPSFQGRGRLLPQLSPRASPVQEKALMPQFPRPPPVPWPSLHPAFSLHQTKLTPPGLPPPTPQSRPSLPPTLRGRWSGVGGCRTGLWGLPSHWYNVCIPSASLRPALWKLLDLGVLFFSKKNVFLQRNGERKDGQWL